MREQLQWYDERRTTRRGSMRSLSCASGSHVKVIAYSTSRRSRLRSTNTPRRRLVTATTFLTSRMASVKVVPMLVWNDSGTWFLPCMDRMFLGIIASALLLLLTSASLLMYRTGKPPTAGVATGFATVGVKR
jgi:hypothetical protein